MHLNDSPPCGSGNSGTIIPAVTGRSLGCESPVSAPLAPHALGREKESDTALRKLIAKYQAIGPYQIAEIYAFRNQSDEAFEWLDRAYAQRDSGLIETKVDPLLKNLHSDPRYAAFLKKLNLPT